jgi:phage gp36-like protein
MPYATASDMTARFGEEEMIHLTAPQGELDGPAVTARIDVALAESSALIDSYLRRRYLVPLVAPIPAEVVRATCILARYDLAHGEQKDPTEQMRLARKEVIAWLEQLAAGDVQLAGVPLAGGSGAGAMVRDRPRAFSDDALRGW